MLPQAKLMHQQPIHLENIDGGLPVRWFALDIAMRERRTLAKIVVRNPGCKICPEDYQ